RERTEIFRALGEPVGKPGSGIDQFVEAELLAVGPPFLIELVHVDDDVGVGGLAHGESSCEVGINAVGGIKGREEVVGDLHVRSIIVGESSQQAIKPVGIGVRKRIVVNQNIAAQGYECAR